MKNNNKSKHLTIRIAMWLLIFAVTVAFLIVVKNNKNETRLVLSKFFRTFVFQEDYHP